jgi:hypothetical protein
MLIDSQTGEAISIAEKLPSYSTLFSVVLPSLPSSLTEKDSAPIYTPAPPSSSKHTPGNYLPNLPAIFLPPPFTPSHPVFVHLSALASNMSQALRTDAEAYLAELTKRKVDEIEKTEAELRKHVEALWRSFRDGVEKADLERNAQAPPARTKDSGKWSKVEPGTSKPSPALISIHDFKPVSSPRRVSSSTFTPRKSSLSASLATSSFHHPRAQADQTHNSFSHEVLTTNESPPPYLSNPSSPSSGKGSSSLSSSSSSKSIRTGRDGQTYLEPFRRNMDQANDMATSFRFFTIQEADMARKKSREAQTEANQGAKTEAHSEAPEKAEKIMNVDKAEGTNGSSSYPRKARSKSGDRQPETNEVSPKGKRKVTFDIQPDVVTIEGPVNTTNHEEDSDNATKASEGRSRPSTNSFHTYHFLSRNDV